MREPVVRIYLMAGRKAWHHHIPDSWEEVAFERFDYVECGIFQKSAKRLTKEDKELIAYHSEKPDGWIDPTRAE